MINKNQEITSSLQDMQPQAREALGNKTRQLFSVLKAHYTQYHFAIKDDKQEAAMLQHWAKALLVGKVNEEMLRNGLAKAKAHSIEDDFCKWPNLGQFIAWCHGIPSPESAYFETTKNCHDLTIWEPSHPIVALTGREVGFSNIKTNENQKHYKAEYIRIYCEMLARVMAGEVFEYQKKEKPIAIEKQERTEQQIEEGKQHLAMLTAMLTGKDDKPQDSIITEEKKQQRLAEIRKKIDSMKAIRGEK